MFQLSAGLSSLPDMLTGSTQQGSLVVLCNNQVFTDYCELDVS